ncbi:hypothetical protein M1N89_01270 [Dehalococcoidia bacterium]|nr:hypothetical protein [Dehalococcoidia bacterium]
MPDNMPDNDFRGKLVNQIKEKRQVKQKLEQQRFEIQSQLKVLEDDLRDLESALSVYDRLTGIASATSATPNSNAWSIGYAYAPSQSTCYCSNFVID